MILELKIEEYNYKARDVRNFSILERYGIPVCRLDHNDLRDNHLVFHFFRVYDNYSAAIVHTGSLVVLSR